MVETEKKDEIETSTEESRKRGTYPTYYTSEGDIISDLKPVAIHIKSVPEIQKDRLLKRRNQLRAKLKQPVATGGGPPPPSPKKQAPGGDKGPSKKRKAGVAILSGLKGLGIASRRLTKVSPTTPIQQPAAIITPLPTSQLPFNFTNPITAIEKKEKPNPLPYVFLTAAAAPLAYVGWKLYEKSHSPTPIPPVSDPNLLQYINDLISKLVKASLLDINLAISDINAVINQLRTFASIGIADIDNEIKSLVPQITLTVHDIDNEINRIVSGLPHVVGVTIQDIDNEIHKIIPVNSLALKSDIDAVKHGINGTVIGGINTIINAWNNFGFGPYSVFGIQVVPRIQLPHINTIGNI